MNQGVITRAELVADVREEEVGPHQINKSPNPQHEAEGGGSGRHGGPGVATAPLGPRRGGARRDLAASAAPPPVYLCPGPGAASFSIFSESLLLTLPPRRLRPLGLCHGSVAVIPSCPCPGSALTAPALSAPTVCSAEAAAASSPSRSHGVSNRSPLPRQPPFPPFHRARGASRAGLVGGAQSDEPRARRRRRGKVVAGRSDEHAHLARAVRGSAIWSGRAPLRLRGSSQRLFLPLCARALTHPTA